MTSKAYRIHRERFRFTLFWVALLWLLCLPHPSWSRGEPIIYKQSIPMLAVTTGEPATGTVLYVSVAVKTRSDVSGLTITFADTPGRFSSMAQQSIERAVTRTARSLGLETDSWTVTLSVPYPGVTVYGDSLSGMIGVSVTALAQGIRIRDDVVMTGTITPDGLIGPVGAVDLKLAAAAMAKFQTVLVSEQHLDENSADRRAAIPHLFYVRSAKRAFSVLTGVPDAQ